MSSRAPWISAYPYAGAGRNAYSNVFNAFGSVHVHKPSAPGREARYTTAHARSFDELADDAWQQLQREFGEGHDVDDLVLFGYSMGGLLAVEMARRIETEAGVSPKSVIVGGAPPPHLVPSRLAENTDEALVEHLRTVGIAPPAVLDDQELLALFLPTLRADYSIVDSHPRAAFTLNCRLLVLAGRSDPFVTFDDLLAWLDVGNSQSEVTCVSGTHASVLNDFSRWQDLLLREVGSPVNETTL